MININNVIKELSVLLAADEESAAKYRSIAESTAKSVEHSLKNNEDAEDNRIIYLCAVKAFYRIALSESDNICSFSAGDISYSKNSSAAENAEKLLTDALNDCRNLLETAGFAFKVV